jgi:hypothetical protein
VFDAGGRGLLLLKLMQPPNAKKISRIRTRMVILGSGALSQALNPTVAADWVELSSPASKIVQSCPNYQVRRQPARCVPCLDNPVNR